MSTVITVQNLGKKYTISHQQREEYSSLRDVITNSAFSLGRKLIRPFRSSLEPLPLAPASEDFWALKDVNFEVKQGDRIGIIGRNGAGKSTLLKTLSRITEPTTGSIRIKGRVASLLEVGTGFHPELTGRENIFLNGAILGMRREEIRRKFDEIVDFAEIERFLDTPVKHYSSGMYVRLAFAVAAHLEPEILIVDEVLAVGDAQFQRKCLGKMEEVGQEGRTLLFVSHQLGAIQKICTHCFLLGDGTVQRSGKTSEVVEEYLSGCRPGTALASVRKGTGTVTFADFHVGEIDGKLKEQFFMGDTIYVYFSLAGRESLATIDVSLELRDVYGDSVAHISNEDDGAVISCKGEMRSDFCVAIPECSLAPKNYFISLWAGKLDETYDHLIDCIEITVLQGGILSRKNPYPEHMKCYVPSRWSEVNG
ncbi:MAG: ABC transporter ATP-binding protein [Deltaproteobacteria bacterium]|nr:ABC transporter ATP-binding protein [Deltaproteobacteria bacterium]